MPRLLIFLLVVSFGFTVAACGGGDGDATPSSAVPSVTASPSVAARDVTDEEYLAVICTGLDNFWIALNTARTVDEIRATVTDFIANLEVVLPAPDVRPFHAELLGYLNESIEDPTQLATSPRPLPEEAVRSRLAGKESDVSECDDLTFFAARPEDQTG